VRSGLRRHGVVPRPPQLRRLLGAPDVRFTFGNVLDVHADGRAGLDAMLEAIEAARRQIHLETYILRADAVGRRFIAALAARADAGVEVRVLYDAIGSRGLDAVALAELRAAGGVVVAFNPLSRLYPRWAPRRRDHRKLLVVDGEVAFTGGLNVGDEYYEIDGGSPAWRDAHVRVTGPAVAMLDAVFLESWFRADAPDRPWIGIGETPADPAGGEAVAVVADGPTYRRRRVRDLLVAALQRARDHARIATPYFMPGRRLRVALAAAAARGVRVEILLAGRTDHPSLRWAARDRLPPLLASGVKAYEYDRAMMHAKVAVFDGSWALIGTSNLDRQSLEHSYEVNLLVEGDETPDHLHQLLGEDMAAAREITSEWLANRNVFERLRDAVAARLLMRL
jgi:cardiolipin synthase